jgi:hypothetical protein
MDKVLNEYEQHANETIAQMGINFKSEFDSHGRHFPDDKDTRDIWICTFTREGKKPLVIRFGQSIINSGGAPKGGQVWGRGLDATGMLERKRRAPRAYDVLACIQKYPVDSFSDFCSCFGYDEDSIKARDLYIAVGEEAAKVARFFSPEELTIIQEIN